MSAKFPVFVICVGATIFVHVCSVLHAGYCTFRFCISVPPQASAAGDGRYSGVFNIDSSEKCIFQINIETPTID